MLVLYWVEGSSWSSRVVAQYNGGYGTFDMKSYDVHIVESVLASMAPEGFKASYRYYMGDNLFIIFFGLIQCVISQLIYYSLKSKIKIARIIFVLSFIILILRGIADLIENTMLVYTLMKYPAINERMIDVASIATNIKLSCITVWNCLAVVGLIMIVILKFKGIVYKK
jgi:hypothetical protein